MQEVLEGSESPFGAGHHIEQHGVTHAELADQLFGLGFQQPFVGLLGPGGPAARSRFLTQLLDLPGIGSSALPKAEVLNFVFGGLDNDGAFGVVSRAASSTGNLVKLAGFQHSVADPIKLGQFRHQHRADRHVDSDP